MQRICIIFLFVGINSNVFSQEQADTLQSDYILRYPDYFFVWPVLKRKSLNFNVSDKKEDESIDYKPNNSYTVGLGAYVFDLALELTFAIPINEKDKKTFGESKVRDFQINALSSKWGGDLYYQKYTGFYEDDGSYYPDNKPYPQRSDITSKNFGLTGLYVFNEKKFSARSAFNFSERQLKRGGSWLLTGTVNSFKLKADSAVVSAKYRNIIGGGSSFEELRYTTFSIAPGYAYNFIYRKFFLSGALMLGPAHNWTYYKEEDQPEKNDIGINLFTSSRVGVGYSDDRFFAGINFVVQSRVVRFEDIRVSNSTSTFRFLVGYRFREFGILKKSIWDFPKELLNL
ncbi:MAG TPA: DUF4421 domain-containing protein [Cyclobacteriaceae bacterium]|nr:DUF4421 domain-containing protein [Cyclobacteriaceae bacterium]